MNNIYQFWVYGMTNTYNNVLYIGVTNDLYRRVMEHKSGEISGFTKEYNCNKLVFYEEYNNIEEAIAREKQLKNWKREWKNVLIEKMNPAWEDLSINWGWEDESY